jgi:hypothetical protein
MDHQDHLVVRTPDPNLSHAMRWLNVSYSGRFNWDWVWARRSNVGPW